MNRAGPGTVLLRLDRVGVRYGTHRAVEDVTLEAPGGEMLALVGPNGSGKSSLLRAAAGLVRCEGRITRAWPDGGAVGFLPQDNGARAALTVLETVLLGRLRALGLRVPDSELTRAGRALAQLGIAGLAPRLLSELSGGQRQLVFLAQLLCAEPAALLLDEPTSALDLRHTFELLALLRTLARDRGVPVIVALHDLNAAARFADRVAVLDGGRLVATGVPRAVFTPELLARVYGMQAEVMADASGRPIIVPLAAIPRSGPGC